MKKQPISITIDKDLINWIDKEIKNSRIFRNRSHLIEIAIENLKDKNG